MEYQQLLEKKTIILKIAEKYGAYRIRVFGSVARGEADEKSDVDFLVNLEEDRSLFDLGGLQYDLQQSLKVPVDVVTENGLYGEARQRIIKEAREL